jgi:hypothetical protein
MRDTAGRHAEAGLELTEILTTEDTELHTELGSPLCTSVSPVVKILCSALLKTQPSVPFFFQKLLHFERRHAPGTSSRDGLSVAAVLHIATGEYSWHFC